MCGDLVERVSVDSLDNVDFAVVRPVATDSPVRGPSTTAVGHSPHIGDEQTSGIVFLLRVDVNTRNTQRSDKLAIDAQLLYDARS